MLSVLWHGVCLLELVRTEYAQVLLVYESEYLLQRVLLEVRDPLECLYELIDVDHLVVIGVHLLVLQTQSDFDSWNQLIPDEVVVVQKSSSKVDIVFVIWVQKSLFVTAYCLSSTTVTVSFPGRVPKSWLKVTILRLN